MFRPILTAALMAALTVTVLPSGVQALTASGPGSAADAREAYTFFFSRLQEVYFQSNGDRILRATEIASQIATAGKGAAQEAITAYTFFFGKLQEVYFQSNGERIQSSISMATIVGRAGRGAALEAQESYVFFFSKLQEVYYASNGERIKAALALALKVATEGPPAVQPNPALAVTGLAVNAPRTGAQARQIRWQRVLNHALLYRQAAQPAK